ncbi:MAG: hypothetical protein J0I06_03630 [Planctomycetes bacterium]|nr:hypothetical protein [Planctomycetota bacterium]
MSRFCLVLLVALCPPVLLAEDKKEPPFVSKEGKFQVALAGKPIEKVRKVKIGDREQDLHVFSVEQKGVAHVVTYLDYPKGTIGEDKEKFLAGVVARNVGQLKGKVAAEEKVALGKGKHPGRDVRVDLPDKKQLYRARVFLVGDRVYQIVALGPEEAVKGKETDDFLKSFAVDE